MFRSLTVLFFHRTRISAEELATIEEQAEIYEQEEGAYPPDLIK